MKPLLRLLIAGLAGLVLAAGCSSDGTDCEPKPTFAVVGAMPSELAPLLARATIDETRVIEGRAFHIGHLGGARVVLAMTGIGLVNAATTSRLIFNNFPEVIGIVFSGVAGSPHRIADVTVPLTWSGPGGPSFVCDQSWLDAAQRVAGSGEVALDRCADVPPNDPAAKVVCMPFEPAIFVSGRGSSSDPFNGSAVVCRPGGDDVFGCDPSLGAGSAADATAQVAGVPVVAADDEEEEVTADMETAAVAREAAQRGLRFIAFRAVSDGAEDPLGLPGFPTEFFAYYQLAARNAAIAAEAFLGEISSQFDDSVFCQ